MDIKPPVSSEKRPITAQVKTDSLDLKLHQQLEVKIISSKADTQAIALEILSSNKPLQVKSNLPFEGKIGQILNLVVTKLTPSAEFKIVDIEANKSLSKEAIIFKTNIPAALSSNSELINKTAKTAKAFTNTTPIIISAKIISIKGDNIQLKLYTSPSIETASYSKKQQQNILQQKDPIITLNKQQLLTAEPKTLKPGVLKSIPQQTVNQMADYKPGQRIQLEVNRSGLNPEFKIITTPELKLTKGQIITANIIGIDNNKIKLGNIQNNGTQPNTSQLDKTGASLLKTPQPTTNINNKLVISVTEKQLILASENSNSPIKNVLQTLRPNQQLVLEVKKAGSQPEFKIMDASLPKIKPGQVITATVVGVKNEQVQLQLRTPENTVNTSTLLVNKESAALPNNRQQTSNMPIITLDKQQLLSPGTSSVKESVIPINNLKPGQKIQLEIVKTGDQIGYKLLPPTISQEQKIAESVKQLFPIQQAPSELVNQLIDNLPAINNNEKIPDALKRLAREIIESLPQLKEIDDPKQIKKILSQSGLFLEAKLAQAMSNKDVDVQSDFKTLLLKFQHALKQELEVSQEDKKAQSTEVNLIKEMQQKTESSLAKIILNQFSSLPREDSTRNVWILDLPFLNRDNAENVRVEIDRERQADAPVDRENWTVNVTVTPDDLVTIHCKISCYNETINTVFWSDNEGVVDEIDLHLGYLKTQLEKSGLSLGHMSASIGVPVTKLPQQIKGQTLFDQKV